MHSCRAENNFFLKKCVCAERGTAGEKSTLGQEMALMKQFKKKDRRGERLELDAERMGRSGGALARWGCGAVQGGEGGGCMRGQKGENKCLAKAGRRRDSFRVGLWPVAEEEDGVRLGVFITV